MANQVILSRKSFLTSFLVLFICTLTVAALFLAFSLAKFNERVTSAGASTFSSITETTATRLESQLSHQVTVVQGFSQFLQQQPGTTETEILYYMNHNRELWGMKELAVKTETGRYFNSYGNEFFLDLTPEQQRTPVIDTWNSKWDTIYLIHPVNTQADYHDEIIQAISGSIAVSKLLAQSKPLDFYGNMQTFLITTTGERLNNDSHSGALDAENLISFAEENLEHSYFSKYESVTSTITDQRSWIGTVRYNGTEYYMGFVPMAATSNSFYLVTAIESHWVNATNAAFGTHVLILSLLLIFLALSVALLSFLSFHRKNKEYVEGLLTSNKQESDTQLQAALELAQQSNAAKTVFLSQMSHDIRTPMNAIINMTDFAISDIDDKEKLRDHLNVIKTSSTHLLNLINDVLDMSHIESGKMVLKHLPFAMSDVLDEVSAIIKAAAAKKNITFSSHVIVLNHNKLKGDNLRLQQVLINLLNNAVKFTPEGGTVVLSVEELPNLKHNYQAYQFTITDTGCGIAAETLDKIFEPFARIEAKGQKIEGTGLGLAITKSIVDAMNGDITVQSTPGAGSIFTVRIPFEINFSMNEFGQATDGKIPEATEEEKKELPQDLSGVRLLVAEDIALNRQILQHMFAVSHITCDFAVNGKECFEKFQKSDPYWYSMILMDIQMPEMNGYEATREIRLCNHPQAGIIPIIAMTANVFDEDVQRCRAAGMNAHLGKPIEHEALLKTIASYL